MKRDADCESVSVSFESESSRTFIDNKYSCLDKREDHVEEPWFYPDLRRANVNEVFTSDPRAENGSFLVRESKTVEDAISLEIMNSERKIKHILIHKFYDELTRFSKIFIYKTIENSKL